MEEFTTEQLVEELARREAVQRIFTEPYKEIEILVGNKKQDLQMNEGPVNILIVWD